MKGGRGQLELRQLTYYVAAAEELHFERAARRLCMTQPPLSQAIKQLEEEMGAGLFERSHRRIRLTRAGEAFLEEARHVICATDHAVERARLADRGEWGRLTVGFVGSATYDMVIRMYRQEYPDIAVETRELSTSMQIEALRQKVARITSGPTGCTVKLWIGSAIWRFAKGF